MGKGTAPERRRRGPAQAEAHRRQEWAAPGADAARVAAPGRRPRPHHRRGRQLATAARAPSAGRAVAASSAAAARQAARERPRRAAATPVRPAARAQPARGGRHRGLRPAAAHRRQGFGHHRGAGGSPCARGSSFLAQRRAITRGSRERKPSTEFCRANMPQQVGRARRCGLRLAAAAASAAARLRRVQRRRRQVKYLALRSARLSACAEAAAARRRRRGGAAKRPVRAALPVTAPGLTGTARGRGRRRNAQPIKERATKLFE